MVQSQQTGHLAAQELGDYVEDQSAEGELLESGAFLLRPRAIVVVGSLAELVGPSGGALRDRVRSFELFRRNLQEPEIMTFDELVARAEWYIDLAAGLTDADEK